MKEEEPIIKITDGSVRVEGTGRKLIAMLCAAMVISEDLRTIVTEAIDVLKERDFLFEEEKPIKAD